MIAYNIQWDFDENNKDSTVLLPDYIKIPKDLVDDIDAISGYISDVTGLRHKGFSIKDFER